MEKMQKIILLISIILFVIIIAISLVIVMINNKKQEEKDPIFEFSGAGDPYDDSQLNNFDIEIKGLNDEIILCSLNGLAISVQITTIENILIIPYKLTSFIIRPSLSCIILIVKIIKYAIPNINAFSVDGIFSININDIIENIKILKKSLLKFIPKIFALNFLFLSKLIIFPIKEIRYNGNATAGGKKVILKILIYCT